jgi:cytoskeleton protein RodZ
MSDSEHDLTPLLAPGASETVPPASDDLLTSGQLLQKARKASGLSLEQLSARVKVSVPRLLALEEDRLEAWPDANVARAVAGAVCRQVQLDPAVVLDRMPKARPTDLILPNSLLPADFRDRSVLNLRGAPGVAAWPGKPIVFVAGLLVLAFLALVYGSELRSEFVRTLDGDSAVGPAPVADSNATPVLPPDAGPTDTRSTAVPVPSEVNPPLVSSAFTATSGVAAVGAKERPLPVTTPVQTSAVSSGALVSFKATGETWIEVNDAKGVLLLRRTLLAGDAVSASGEVPLSIVVGRADHTEVAVRGKAMKLEPSSTDNVARFKVQ